MKRLILILSVAAIAFTSCKTNSEPQFTPQIYVSEMVAWHTGDVQSHDTLRVTFIDNEHIIDTVAVGDTVRFAVLINAVTNQLTSFTAKTDAGVLDMKMELTSEHSVALEESSNPDNCELYFKPGYGAATIPMEYIALKSGSAKVTMTLSTTSEFSPGTLSFRQPVE